uniref:Phospholipase A(2) n=1 Tax=Acrobeloides nanus TaxID=290746 RepID=A0A914C803_9BILA
MTHGVPSRNRREVTHLKNQNNFTQSEISLESSEEIEWYCGADELSKWISESTIDKDCPPLKMSVNQCCMKHDKCYDDQLVSVNQCCMKHDKCYDDQLGRKYCDDTFCTCLDIATKTHTICNQEDGPTFCSLVQELGQSAYEAAGLAKNNLKKLEPDSIGALMNITSDYYENVSIERESDTTSHLRLASSSNTKFVNRTDSPNTRYHRRLMISVLHKGDSILSPDILKELVENKQP